MSLPGLFRSRRSRLLLLAALFAPLATCGETGTEPQLSAIKVAFSSQPTSVTAGEKMSPIAVGALNVKNVVATGATPSVTIGLVAGAGSAGAVLAGTLIRDAVAGVATFDDLSVAKAGSGFKLVATSAGLVLATSDAFTVTPGTPTTLSVKTQPANATSGASVSPSVEVSV